MSNSFSRFSNDRHSPAWCPQIELSNTGCALVGMERRRNHHANRAPWPRQPQHALREYAIQIELAAHDRALRAEPLMRIEPVHDAVLVCETLLVIVPGARHRRDPPAADPERSALRRVAASSIDRSNPARNSAVLGCMMSQGGLLSTASKPPEHPSRRRARIPRGTSGPRATRSARRQHHSCRSVRASGHRPVAATA